MRALKMRSTMASHCKVTTTNWEPSLKLILLQLREKLPKNSVLTIPQSFGIWSKLERWKSSTSSASWPDQKKKKGRSGVSSLILWNSKPFLDWIVMCNEKWILYDNWQAPAQWLVRVEAPKHFPKPNLHPKRSWSLAVCCRSHPLQLSESRWNDHVWETCSANWCDAPKTATPAAGQQKGPDSSAWQCWTTRHATSTSMNWATKFCLICHNLSPTDTTSSSISTTFCRENASITSRRQKMLSKSSLNPEVWIFMLQE